MARYHLWVVFHRQGMQWPLREPDDVLEMRNERMELVARIPAATLEAILAHHADELAVLALFQRTLPDPWRKPLAEAREAMDDPGRRASLRAKRRTRRRNGRP